MPESPFVPGRLFGGAVLKAAAYRADAELEWSVILMKNQGAFSRDTIIILSWIIRKDASFLWEDRCIPVIQFRLSRLKNAPCKCVFPSLGTHRCRFGHRSVCPLTTDHRSFFKTSHEVTFASLGSKLQRISGLQFRPPSRSAPFEIGFATPPCSSARAIDAA